MNIQFNFFLMILYIGSDHAGFELKEVFKKYLDGQGVRHVDLGAFSLDPIDYPDIAYEVCEKILEHDDGEACGLLICGTGLGMCIVANKVKGIRAASIVDEKMAEMARRHNNANVICLAGRSIDQELAKKIVSVFLNTPFDGEERHVRRIEKIE